MNKASTVSGATPTETDMQHINRLTLRELTTEDVYTFRCVACNDLVDRDFERFPAETLAKLAPMFVGRTVILDHCWTAKGQTARIYRSEVVRQEDGHHDLLVACYMLRNDSTADAIAAIEGGILKETSVGCAVSRAVCSICGEDYGTCGHQKGATYNGKLCTVDLLDPVDAYEMSFVAVPAQPGAGVIKSHEKTGWTTAELSAAKARLAIERERWN
ncbi:MAG: hypothetical protein IJ960_00875 [Oscillospiraceae bacterium]|nr:hypothetical protein [Oscillospiraceae bacterium]